MEKAFVQVIDCVRMCCIEVVKDSGDEYREPSQPIGRLHYTGSLLARLQLPERLPREAAQ